MHLYSIARYGYSYGDRVYAKCAVGEVSRPRGSKPGGYICRSHVDEYFTGHII